jgi:hypothetical protein
MYSDPLLIAAEFGRAVTVLAWPAEGSEREALQRAGRPRLLVVAPGAALPPPSDSCLEDWVRAPVEPDELRTRLETLAERARHHPPVPQIDEMGQLVHCDDRVPLSPTEERLVRVLIGSFGAVVADDDLLRAGWPDGSGSPGALRVHLTRLRRRLAHIGLELRSRRGTGHSLQSPASASSTVEHAAAS